LTKNEKEKKYGPQTIGIHMGSEGKNSQYGPVNTPIYASSTFAYPTVKEGGLRFSGETAGFVYGRMGNPTVRDIELRLAKLDEGDDALLLASGMAAVSTMIYTILKKGDHLIADISLYGGTHALFTNILSEYGIEVDFVDATEPKLISKLIKSNTKLIYFETPTNPTLRIISIKEVVGIANKHNILTAIDSTFMSPILMQPITMGVDIVIHSVTKYLNGHSDVLAGVIISNQSIIDQCKVTSIHHGGILGPFEAYLIGRGLKTLRIRIEEHEKNGKLIAEYLSKHPKVNNLQYLGDSNHPQHELAKSQQKGFGSMMTFELHGNFEDATKFINSLEIATRAVSLGGVETLISHPASTTHSKLSENDRKKAGITDTLFRLSVGIEEADDLINDFDNAFKKLT